LEEARSQKKENVMETFSLANLEDVGNARLTGEALAMKVRKMSVAQRAALAARLVHCEVSVAGFIPTRRRR
jgi:hypothetical protein